MRLEDMFSSSEDYARAALAGLAEAARFVAMIRPKLLEELAGGGGRYASNAEQRDAAVKLAQAAKDFLEAARVARERGVL